MNRVDSPEPSGPAARLFTIRRTLMRSSVAALVIIIAAVFSGLPGWVPIVALVGLLLNLSALRQVTKQLQKYSLPTSPHTPGGDGTS